MAARRARARRTEAGCSSADIMTGGRSRQTPRAATSTESEPTRLSTWVRQNSSGVIGKVVVIHCLSSGLPQVKNSGPNPEKNPVMTKTQNSGVHSAIGRRRANLSAVQTQHPKMERGSIQFQVAIAPSH